MKYLLFLLAFAGCMNAMEELSGAELNGPHTKAPLRRSNSSCLRDCALCCVLPFGALRQEPKPSHGIVLQQEGRAEESYPAVQQPVPAAAARRRRVEVALEEHPRSTSVFSNCLRALCCR